MRKMRSQSEVELNLASMLDMAFQLLAFFILTVQPAGSSKEEAELERRLPAQQAVISIGDRVDSNVKSAVTLTINVLSDNGSIDALQVGIPTKFPMVAVAPDSKLQNLQDQLTGLTNTGFEQLIIQYSPNLRWGELMRVTDVCAKRNIKSMNFVALAANK